MPKKDPRITQVTILVLLIGAFILRGLGINTLTEYIILAIAITHLGLNIRTPKG